MFYVDIIGILTGVGTECEFRKEGRISKMNVISIDCDGQCSNFIPPLFPFLN